MGLLNLLTAGTNPTKIVNEGMKLVDNAFFTDEEKAKMQKDLIIESNKVYLEGLKDNNATRSITRRWIALPITYMYLLGVLAVMVMSIMGMDKEQYIQPIIDVIKQMSVPFTVVLGFYFGGHLVTGLKK